MDDIPVTFAYKEQEVHGHLSRVAGAGTNAMYHLIVNKYHWGQFFYRESWPEGWVFGSSTINLSQAIVDHLERVMISFYA